MTDVLGRQRYRVDRPLGVGAMGTVQLGWDTVLDRVVAIKILADHLAADDVFRQRFLQESRLAARLGHPHIVQVFDAGEDGGRPYLVMEYVEGESVAQRLAAGRRFTAAELTTLGTQLAAGLAHAHARGVVHRDVKPHNVMLRRDGVAKLADFGIARAVEDRGLTEIGTVLGTAPFMAPEQAAGRPVGPAADVYALGALLGHCADGPLPAGLQAVVDAALAADPTARPPAADLHDRLLAMAAGPADPEYAAPTVVAAAGPAGSEVAAGTVVASPSPDSEVAAGTVVASPAATSGAAPPASADSRTEFRPAGRTQVLPPSVLAWFDRWSPRAAGALAAAAVLVVLLGVALHHQGAGAAKPSASTSTTGPAQAVATPVPPGADPAQAAHNLADWLRAQSK